MEWYYADQDRRVGPVADEEFHALVASGAVTDATMVWQNGMADWAAYGTVAGEARPSPEGAPGYVTCAECGLSFAHDEVIQYRGSYICGPCKPVFFQRIKEGGALAGDLNYGGFWIRFAAKFLDNVITMVFVFAVTFLLGIMSAGSEEAYTMVAIASFVLAYGIPVLYNTFFIGKFAATPGKMAAGLKVIRPDGGRVTYRRALGRYFGELLSGITLLIGYIMAAFDEEKRALHDRICDTRVIRVR